MPRSSPSYDKGYRDGYKAAVAELTARPTVPVDDLAQWALEETEHYLRAATGYIRCGVGQDKTIYVRYKWTVGIYADHYTMGSGHNIAAALVNLIEHISQVEAGKRKPHPDKPYRKYPPKG